MSTLIENIRIDKSLPLDSPQSLKSRYVIQAHHRQLITTARETISNIINDKDERLLVIVGPCSIHDTKACMDYAQRLKAIVKNYPKLFLVMRVYFEKPRTIVGWKGLINDPSLDEEYNINEGLAIARELLLEVTELGLPVATEFLDTILGQYYSDLISLAAIGARTTESQIHRQLASGLSMPVGLKNRTDGDTKVAMDAIRSANYPHTFPSIGDNGESVIFTTKGNDDSFLILRGGNKSGTNYHEDDIRAISAQQKELKITKRMIVDCSHGNSHKDPDNQKLVVNEILKQHNKGLRDVAGIMLESFLVPGRQDLTSKEELIYGQSITDACLSFEETVSLLDTMNSSLN